MKYLSCLLVFLHRLLCCKNENKTALLNDSFSQDEINTGYIVCDV